MAQLVSPPPRPHSVRGPETAMDRTQILLPDKLWPNPLDCPDWPIEYDRGYTARRYSGKKGRDGATERLRYLSELLNRGGALRAPSEAEREDAFNRIFTRSGNTFIDTGIADLGPLDRNTETQAKMVVEAAHILGYLRKLDALEAKAKANAEAATTANAQSRLDDFARFVERNRAELAERAEAEARHRQRIEDEKAFLRCDDIRRNIGLAYSDAVQAAAVLGVDAPARPVFD